MLVIPRVVIVLALALAPVALSAQVETRTGMLVHVYVDPPRGGGRAGHQYAIVDDMNRWTRLDVDAATLARSGGAALERRRVTVTGSVVRGPGGKPQIRVASLAASGGTPMQLGSPQSGTLRYVNIICLYSDNTPDDPRDANLLSRWMTNVYPGMQHYFTDMSLGKMTFDGSVVIGPVVTPFPTSKYEPAGGRDLGAVLEDCTAAADTQVNFPDFDGVNIWVTGRLNGYSFGTTGAWISRDGVARFYKTTWMGYWAPATFAHEIGHTLGWPHSNGGYATEYDSQWDVMSNAYTFYDPGTSPAAWVAGGTITAYKDQAGWIPGDRVYTAAPGSRRSIRLERGSRPATDGYLMARLPFASGTEYYTAEARRQAELDRGIPADAVVLHRTSPSSTDPLSFGATAYVVDVDRNGDPNDDAARWTPGETFVDELNRVSLRVDSFTTTGAAVTIANQASQLAATVTGPGRVTGTGIGCPGDCEEIFTFASPTVALTAVPDNGAVFLGWSGDCTGSGTCSVSLTRDRAVTALFSTPVVISSDAARPRGLVGRTYLDFLVASGGIGSIVWTLTSGALPPGLTVAPGTGRVSGTPAQPGSYTFALRAAAGALEATRTFSVLVGAPVAISTTSPFPAGVINEPYSAPLGATGGFPSFDLAWRITAGTMPPGLVLRAGPDVIVGTPTIAGRYEFTLEVSSDTLRAQRAYLLEVFASVGIVSADPRRAGTMGAPYADTLVAVGGDGTFTWVIEAGALPPGVALAPGGTLAGTPEATGNFAFTTRATSGNLSSSREFHLLITAPALASGAVLDQLLGAGTPLSADARRYLDLLGNRNGRMDVGDVRAWLVDAHQLPASATVTAVVPALERLSRTKASR